MPIHTQASRMSPEALHSWWFRHLTYFTSHGAMRKIHTQVKFSCHKLADVWRNCSFRRWQGFMIHRSLTRVWIVKHPFNIFVLPTVDYHSAPTRIHRRWNSQHLWGRARCPQVIDSPNTQVCASEPATSIRTQLLLKPMALKHMPACSAVTKPDTDLDTDTQTP